jgi:hypothetical protein
MRPKFPSLDEVQELPCMMQQTIPPEFEDYKWNYGGISAPNF